MKAGADVNMQNKDGSSPILVASLNGHTDTVGTDSFVSLGVLVVYLVELHLRRQVLTSTCKIMMVGLQFCTHHTTEIRIQLVQTHLCLGDYWCVSC